MLSGETLQGKVALITGGGTGIGAATAAVFAAQGASVVLVGRRPEPLSEAAKQLSDAGFADAVLVAPADAGDGEQMRAVVVEAVAEFGGLDIVVANAGGHGLGPAGEIDDAAWQASLHANLTTCFVTARESLPALLTRGGGSVIVVSSIAGLAAGPEACGYVTTKHALIGFARSMARDYGPRGIRVNALCPGWVRTAMADEQMDALAERHGLPGRDEAYLLATSETPLRRPASAAEIANICLFLASDMSSAMTGSVLVADSGATAVDLPTLAFEREPYPRP